jgi:hypothetical protein
MTTAADVRHVVQELLYRNSDLVLSKRLVAIKPITHVIRGIYLDASIHPGLFKPCWFAQATFEGDPFVSFNWGERFLGAWLKGEPGLERRLVEAVETIALPQLRPVLTLPDFLAFASRGWGWGHPIQSFPHRKFVVDIGLGDLATARAYCPALRRWAGLTKAERRPMTSILRYAEELVPLVEADDREAMARLLWRWVAAMIKALKLDKHWRREPFPLEVQNGLTAWKDF